MSLQDLLAATAPAAPAPTPSFDPNAVTPGVTGFIVTAVFFVACALLVWSLVRRVSRLTHREQVRAELEAEREQMLLAELDPDRREEPEEPGAPGGR